MVVSNDVFDNQLQACSGSVDPTGESVLQIRIKTRFVRVREREQSYPVKPMPVGVGKDKDDLT